MLNSGVNLLPCGSNVSHGQSISSSVERGHSVICDAAGEGLCILAPWKSWKLDKIIDFRA